MDLSTSGREKAFQAAISSEWDILASRQAHSDWLSNSLSADSVRFSRADEATGSLRSPFVICTDRHPDAIDVVEKKIERIHMQLVYSRGDTACLVAGLELEDIDAVRQSEGLRFVEPLPHPAKLSRSLHAELEPVAGDIIGEDAGVKVRRPGTSRTQTSGEGGGDTDKEQLPRKIRLAHGDGLPADLEVTLTPGTWGMSIARKWTRHLSSFESTAHLWDDHLRERLLWTRSDSLSEVFESSRGQKGDKLEINKMVVDHGLRDMAELWDHVARSSSKSGACDLGSLEVSNDDQGAAGAASRIGRQSGNPPGQAKTHRRRRWGPDTHSRVVLRRVNALGTSPEDNDHCLLTLMAYLITRPEVARLEDLPPVVMMNIEAAWITQSAQETIYPIWEQGIDGRTEVRKSCYTVIVE